MATIALMSLTFVGYWVAYHTYGKYISEKIFAINPLAKVPSKTQYDGKDYVPSKRHVMFGHHFTSIAGTGPIVGPAIGVIWGWVPALIWVFLGSIFMGAVHDVSALIISMRNQGKSISDSAGQYINARVRGLFFCVVFLALLIVMAIFGLVIALIFVRFPESVAPIWLEIPLALGFGLWMLKKKQSWLLSTVVMVVLMYASIYIGVTVPITLPSIAGIPATGLWTIILLGYAYIASILPVPVLLQPRDYLNAWQLYVALAVIIVGIFVAGTTSSLSLAAPAFNLSPEGAPNWWPFLFITIACGAISGFHCLIASGTSSKQIESEADAQFVGYGAMLLEAALATVVIIAVTAGIGMSYPQSGEVLTGLEAWKAHYGSWMASAGMGSKLDAVVIGCANLMGAIKVPMTLGIAVIGVVIASFAGTTLDSATRVQRYILSEVIVRTRFKKYNTKWVTTGIAVITAAILAFSSGANGKGALVLWPMFGAVNQLLGGLALLVATVYLQKKGGLKYLVTLCPCIFLMIITLWASCHNQVRFMTESAILLSILNLIIMGVSIAIVIETIRVLWLTNKKKDKDKKIVAKIHFTNRLSQEVIIKA